MTRSLRRWCAILAGLALVVLGAPTAATAAPSAPSMGIIVKIASGVGNPFTTLLGLLLPLNLAPAAGGGSQGLFLVRPTDPGTAADPAALATLTQRLGSSRGVEYAEPNQRGGLLSGFGFHAWPDGPPVAAGTDPAAWRGQPAVTALQLASAHSRSTGAGIRVAVLDTGVDATHPALAGRVGSGYDYVDGDATPDDRAEGSDSNGDGVPDEAVGHGTFVAGTVELVAPGAQILPYRVLDSDGIGTTFAAARAVIAATDAGAKVVNLSFGTQDGVVSRALSDAVRYATSRGVTVVAAAGNTGSSAPTFPASLPGVLSVAALDPDGTTLAAFSARGSWVTVAAPGAHVVGPVPGGGYARWDGTSVAAPFVAGQIALVRARNPLRLAATVTNAVTATTTRLASGDVAYGAIDVVDSLGTTAGLLPPVDSFFSWLFPSRPR